MAPAAVSVRGLTRDFGAFRAVDGLTFDIAPGEIFGLLGSNGAGKSTAIRMLCGLLTPSAGSASVLDVDIATDPEGVKRRIGYMTQRFSLYEDLTVRQNLHFYGGVYGLRGAAYREREAWAVRQAGLGGKEDRPTGSLPGGWKQRLALACAVLHRPRVLFLDEPTGGVDPVSRRRFWSLIDALAAEGVTVIVTTHYLDEAEHCSRLALMHAGRLVALGAPADLKQVFAGRAILELTCARPLLAIDRLEREPWVREVSLFGVRLHLLVDDAAQGAERAAALIEALGVGPVSIVPIVPSLEDVFIHSIEEAETGRDREAGR